jgi:hypothetical protein
MTRANQTEKHDAGRRLAVLLIIIALGFSLRAVSLVRHHLPEADGAATTLEVATHLNQGQGYTTNRKWLFFDRHQGFPIPEGNRQPLLPLLVALLFLVTGPSHAAAQWLVLGCGLLLIPMVYLLGRRLYGARSGLLAALFTALSPAQVWFGSMVEDQVFFQLGFILLLLLWYRWWAAGASVSRSRALPFLVMGGVAGLAWLARPNGLLLTAALALSIPLVISSVPNWKNRRYKVAAGLACLALVGFLAVSTSWMVRNTLVFGSPFHTHNSYLMAVDVPDEVASLRDGAPSAGSWLAENGMGRAVVRWSRGAFRSLDAFISGNLFRAEAARQGGMAVFLLLALAAWRWGVRRPAPWWRYHALPLAAFGLHFLTVSWYVRGELRYFLPFYLLLYPAAARGVLVLSGLEDTERPSGAGAPPRPPWLRPGRSPILLALLLLLLLATFVRPLGLTLAFDDREEAGRVTAAADWIVGNTEPGTVIMDLPTVSNLIYLYDRPTVVIPYGPLEDTFEAARRFNVEYLVVSARSVDWRPGLKQFWEADGEQVRLRDPAPNFLNPVWIGDDSRIVITRFYPARYHSTMLRERPHSR